MTEYKIAHTRQEFAAGKKLFQEYADSLGFDLSFQGFATELVTLDKQYNTPEGALLIAYIDQIPAGCIGVRKSTPGIAELKRMYVSPRYRGLQIGKSLLEQALHIAKELGYEKIRLDTIPSMAKALELYQKFGFYPIPPYRMNPSEDAIFLEILLT